MRIPRPRAAMLTSGASADVTLHYGQGGADPVQDAKLQYGVGFGVLGLFLGALFGSRYTVHSPVRRRSR